MAQNGMLFRKGPSWFLKYWEDVQVNGAQLRRRKCVKLAEYGDRYRTPRDLGDLVAEKMATVRGSAKCPRSSDLFANYVRDVYLPFVRDTMKPSTYAGYKTYWERYIKPRVGNFALRDFTVAIVSDLLEDVAKSHSLNKDTVSKVRSILSGIFTYAMGKGHFPARSKADNPASCALIPRTAAEPRNTVAATREEVATYLARLGELGMVLERAAVAIVAYTGIRPGEARGLRWEEWDRSEAHIRVSRSVWHAIEGTTKTEKSDGFVPVTEELRAHLWALWNSQLCPISGYILARPAVGKRKPRVSGRVNLDNMAKREIAPALSRCAICRDLESAEHRGHEFTRDETLPEWHGWYAMRRFHGTQVRHKADSDVVAKALRNTKAVADRHYIKPEGVLPDVRKAVNDAMSGISAVN